MSTSSVNCSYLLINCFTGRSSSARIYMGMTLEPYEIKWIYNVYDAIMKQCEELRTRREKKEDNINQKSKILFRQSFTLRAPRNVNKSFFDKSTLVKRSKPSI